MGPRRDPDWLRTLDDVEQAVRGCLATLEKYEAKFGELLDAAPPAAAGAPPAELVPVHDAFVLRLADAGRVADPVEALLAEQEAVWGRWQRRLAAWRESLEQRPAATPP